MTTSRISGIIPLLFITLICVGAVEGGYQLFEHFILEPRPGGEAGTADAPAERLEAKLAARQKLGPEVILQRNLFGVLAGEKVAAPPVPEKIEVLTATSLQIVLMGTITGSEGAERAIILDKAKRKQELYGKGDEVQGALVKEIRRGKVILAQNGREEILDISEAAKMRPRAPMPVPVPPVVPHTAPPAASPAPPESTMTSPSAGVDLAEVEPTPAGEAPAEFLGEGVDTNATQIRLSRVNRPARGQQPGTNNLRSTATQHQGNINE